VCELVVDRVTAVQQGVSMPLDMTAMYAVHDVLRRDLEFLSRVTVRAGDDPRRVLRTASGWQLFRRTLRVHQRAEDDLLWPAVRRQSAGRTGDLVLVEVLEAEHAAIDQLVTTVDELLTDAEADLFRLGDLADSLVTGLGGHLEHEERAAIPLLGRALTAAEWAAFEQAHRPLSSTP
jgi:hemerythrin-like domain-containing protein